MLSIITCSINKNYLTQLQANIAQTIGVPYEHLVLDNRGTGMGICEVYNQLAAKAKYTTLLFLHEDVLFHTNDWGKYLMECFDRTDAPDMIGVAGSNYKSKALSGWYTSSPAYDFYNIVHNISDKIVPFRSEGINKNILHPAVCLDGVFISCTNRLWKKIQFNEVQLKGFHFYDLDFSLRAALEKFNIAVTLKIDLEHITQGGDFGDRWVTQAIHFHQYMKAKLPIPTQIENQSAFDLKIQIKWLDFLKSQKISFGNRVAWIKNQRYPLKLKLVYPLVKFLIYNPLRLNVLHRAIKAK